MMSNVGHSILSTISKSFLITHKEPILYSMKPINIFVHVCNTNDVQYQVHRISFAKFRQLQKRYLTTKNEEEVSKEQKESKSNQSYSSESESFRQQARNSYERKRSSYHNKSYTYEQSQEKHSSMISSEINHYQRLNIDQDADLNAIKSAYYSLSKMYHPDIVGLDDKFAAENFRLVTESYDVLSDSEKKAIYDKELDVASRRNDLSDIFMRASSKHPDKDFNLNFRSRNSEMIFKTMQEAALEREKLKNPNKFRAGVFKTSPVDEDKERRFHNFSKRLTDLRNDSKKRAKLDGGDFYTMHLYNSMLRRSEGLILDNNEFSVESKDTHFSKDDVATLMVSIGVVFIGSLVVIMSFFGANPAAVLDDRLHEFMRKDKNDSSKPN